MREFGLKTVIVLAGLIAVVTLLLLPALREDSAHRARVGLRDLRDVQREQRRAVLRDRMDARTRHGRAAGDVEMAQERAVHADGLEALVAKHGAVGHLETVEVLKSHGGPVGRAAM